MSVGVSLHSDTHGVGDYEKAVNLFHKAASKGQVEAQYILGIPYIVVGLWVRMKKQPCFGSLRHRRQGHAKVKYWLGSFYFDQVVDNEKHEHGENFKNVVEWFTEAAKKVQADAKYWLGVCYCIPYESPNSGYKGAEDTLKSEDRPTRSAKKRHYRA